MPNYPKPFEKDEEVIIHKGTEHEMNVIFKGYDNCKEYGFVEVAGQLWHVPLSEISKIPQKKKVGKTLLKILGKIGVAIGFAFLEKLGDKVIKKI